MAKQDIKQVDERLENVEEALSKTELWIENNQKTLWIILIVLLVIAFGIFGRSEEHTSELQSQYKISYVIPNFIRCIGEEKSLGLFLAALS